MTSENFIDKIHEIANNWGPKLLMGILTLIIGLILIKLLTKLLRNLMTKRKMDSTLSNFLQAMTSILLKILLIISIVSMFGFPVASFIAILASIGFAVGMALSGSLQNFAGGILIIVFRPIRHGDYISTQNVEGFVHDIQLFVTVLKTLDNKTIFLPNGPLSTNIIKNYSTEPKTRLDVSFSISYGDDIDKAKKIMLDTAIKNKKILKKPSPIAQVEELGDSSVNIAIRAWVAQENYWEVHFFMFEAVKKAFDKNGITIPFPQRDVHLRK